jgi:hypothetical protein
VHEAIHVAEIGSTGVAAAIAASHLGLNQVHLLMIVFFSVTLAGQFVSAMMARFSPAALRKLERGE